MRDRDPLWLISYLEEERRTYTFVLGHSSSINFYNVALDPISSPERKDNTFPCVFYPIVHMAVFNQPANTFYYTTMQCNVTIAPIFYNCPNKRCILNWCSTTTAEKLATLRRPPSPPV